MAMKEDKSVLVTGATGHQGGAVARELLARGYRVRAMTRHPDSEKAQELADLKAEIVRGDYDDPASLPKAIDGVWGVFAVQNTWEAGVEREEEQGKRFAKLCREGGVQHYVYTSVGSAHRQTGIPHFDNKWRIEETIRRLEFPSYTIMRPVFFMENFLGPWFLPGLEEGKLAMPVKPTTSLQMIAVEDIGRFGAWAFDNYRRLNGYAFDIAGDERTMPEVAKIFGAAAEREIEFVHVPIEEARKASADAAAMYEWFDAVGYDVDIKALTKETGIRPMTLVEWASEVDWYKHIGAPAGAARQRR
jgi:uncharacterized protein YbjT (DUF2867 family)